MLTVITGTPGAGKTCYTVSKLLAGLVGTTADRQNDDGTVDHFPRTIYTNINGLLLDHELIDGGNTGGIRNWQEWAKPGSVIAFDEFQKVWPPRPNGASVPADIQALDTHRHMGVDFILCTQNVMNVDRHIHGLCNRHIHLRRIGNTRTCIVYEWDHCSRQLLYSKAIAKTVWRLDKSSFKLYKSADLHTKQKRSTPTLVWGILAAMLAAPVLGYGFYERIQAKKNPIGALAAAKSTQAVKPVIHTVKPQQSTSTAVVTVPAGPTRPAFAGCAQSRDVCRCFDAQGNTVQVEPDVCETRIQPLVPPLPASAPFFEQEPIQMAARPEDLDVLKFMGQHRGRAANGFFPY